MRWRHATSPEAFEAKYRSSPDPWNFRYSEYEQNRYSSIISSLSRTHYRHAYEPGCSVGELTRMLARRCERVTATDVSLTALGFARATCQECPNVIFVHDTLVNRRPRGHFDLIVLSEIAYYFTENDLIDIARNLGEALAPEGELLAAHWLGESADHALHGDEAHRVLIDTLSLQHCVSRRFDGYRLDTWTKP